MPTETIIKKQRAGLPAMTIEVQLFLQEIAYHKPLLITGLPLSDNKQTAFSTIAQLALVLQLHGAV
jgi:hypothetical protein